MNACEHFPFKAGLKVEKTFSGAFDHIKIISSAGRVCPVFMTLWIIKFFRAL